MAKTKRNAKTNPRAALVRGSEFRTTNKHRSNREDLTAEAGAATKAISKAKHMALAEKYAKEHGVTLTQALIALM